ncbi:MAG: hexose kinase [Acidimicrobiales bacterium]
MAAIVTLTLNPALDITTSVDVVSHTHKLRCGPASTEAGGGGVNVARVADRLGATALAILPLGGANGTRLARELDLEGVMHADIGCEGETRESFTVNELSTGNQFRFVVPGEPLDADTLQRCRDEVLAACADAKCFVISGSMPGGVPDGYITELIEAVAALGVDVVVDTSGPALLEAIMAPSRVVKPSARELCGAVGRELFTEYEIQGGLVELMASARCGAIVVSIGAGGAMVLDQDGRFVRFRAPSVRVASAVGAGDSMVAGMAVELARGGSVDDAVHLGIAAGTAAVLTAGSELCRPADIESLHHLVTRST